MDRRPEVLRVVARALARGLARVGDARLRVAAGRGSLREAAAAHGQRGQRPGVGRRPRGRLRPRLRGSGQLRRDGGVTERGLRVRQHCNHVKWNRHS